MTDELTRAGTVASLPGPDLCGSSPSPAPVPQLYGQTLELLTA